MNEEVRTLFRDLVDVPPEKRARILADRQIAPEVRAEVESLLEFDSARTVALSDRVSAAAQAVLVSNAAPALPECGPYHLVRPIGSGGMGTVYLGERNDGEIRQQVAIKLLGAQDRHPAWRERFLKERQLLASLHHPSIVHVIDAGHTRDGRPYLVMEYVQGERIDVHAQKLDLHAKLKLFIQVCDAVSHAHRNLIIHRDLKPSNIFVDASGHPKLLDFGIAKILGAASDQTQTGERLLTPEYASPEQVRGQSQTTATDIYSLGAVLYKLLSGKSPHASAGDTQQEMVAAICNREPQPVTRINPSLPRDLDFILAKALRKEPDERYRSVDTLADDLRAFLDSRPVAARSDDVWYRLRKFTRRYWVPFAAASVAFAGLALGLTVSLRERNLAEERFRTVRQIANELFNVEQDINSLPGATAARERIVRTSLDYLERLSEQAGSDLSLKAEIAAGYLKVAEIQGVFGRTNLGHPAAAQASLQKAELLFREVWKAKPQDRESLRGLIRTIDYQTRIDTEARDFARLAPRSAEYQSLLENYAQHAAEDKTDWTFLATGYDWVSSAATVMGELDRAALLAQQSTGYWRKVAQQDKSLAARGGVVNSLSTYARICRNAGKLENALTALNEAASVLQGMLSEQPGNYKTRLNLANTLIAIGRVQGDADGPSLGHVREAADDFERGLRIGRELMAADPKEMMVRYNHSLGDWRLADAIRDEDPGRALAAYDEAVGILRAITLRNFSRDIPLLATLAESTFPLRRLGRTGEARQRLQEAAQIAAPYLRQPSSSAALICDEVLTRAQAAGALADKRPLDAVALHREFLARAGGADLTAFNTGGQLSDAFTLAHRYGLLAAALTAAGQAERATQAESQRRALVEMWKKKLPGNPFVEQILMR